MCSTRQLNSSSKPSWAQDAVYICVFPAPSQAQTEDLLAQAHSVCPACIIPFFDNRTVETEVHRSAEP